jgi:hypothetical protein
MTKARFVWMGMAMGLVCAVPACLADSPTGWAAPGVATPAADAAPLDLRGLGQPATIDGAPAITAPVVPNPGVPQAAPFGGQPSAPFSYKKAGGGGGPSAIGLVDKAVKTPIGLTGKAAKVNLGMTDRAAKTTIGAPAKAVKEVFKTIF